MPQEKQEFIAALERAGWRDALDAAGWTALLARIDDAEQSEGAPHVGLAVFSYDTECIDALGPSRDPTQVNSYADLLRLYAAHSDGKFAPVDVVDKYDESTNEHVVGFALSGQTFERRFASQSDWVSPHFDALINDALAEVGVAERFLLVPYPDQIAFVAFVSESMMKAAEDEGAIPDIRELAAEMM